ncbi:MAG: hypothetical protein WBD36_00810 [Bacteroidota bacterium]
MKRSIVSVVVVFVILEFSCKPSVTNSDESAKPTSADRAKFVGTWGGSYSCLGGSPTPDTLIIRLGSGALDFSIIIHAMFMNPDTVSGALTGANVISVPEQSMGGSPGTAQMTFQGPLLAYSQTGFGITCGGTNYARVP